MNFLLENQGDAATIHPWPEFTAFPTNYQQRVEALHVLAHTQQTESEQSSSKSKKVKATLSGKGKWTKDEQLAYIQFIQDNRSEMETKLMRKSRKVFLNMSKILKTRTADQCRSHHQKILIYHKNLEEIIRFYLKGSDCLAFDNHRESGIKKRIQGKSSIQQISLQSGMQQKSHQNSH